MASYSSELTDGTGLRFQAETTKAVTTKHSMKAINICLWFCSIFGALVGLGYLIFDPLVKHVVLKKLVLSNNSEVSHIWENPPITPHLKVYFFNLTNSEEFFKGKEKAKLVEVGPYVYNYKWIKENVVWHSNGTMSYSTRKVFLFQPDLSVGNHSTDRIVTLNVPVLSAYYQMRDATFVTQYGLNLFIYSLGYHPWIVKTPEELIWGYDEPLFELSRLTMRNPPSFSEFGFFTKKNGSSNLTYTMFTGENNPYDLSKISLFNGKSHLEFWKTDECNAVRGSDGATFNPYISKKDTLWFFNDQLCRSIPLVFDKEVTSHNLPGYRFKPRYDVYKSPHTVPENSCFCADKEICEMLGDGMFDVSICQFDAPIVLSWPHFLDANDTYKNSVEGLQSDPEKHGFWFDVQPTTGTTLSAKARLQINMAIKNTQHFSSLAEVKDVVMPILWFEEGLDELGPELIGVIGQAVLSPPIYKNYVFCIFLGLCASTTVILIVALVRFILNERCNNDRRSQHRDVTIIRNILGESNLHQGKIILDDGATSPMLPSSEYSSTETSRTTTANHSRNSSTGSTIQNVIVNDKRLQSQKLKTLLDPNTKMPNE